MAGFELKNDLELSPDYRLAVELKTVFVRLVAPDGKIRKKALDSFFKSDLVSVKFVTVEIILEVCRAETIPVYHIPINPALIILPRRQHGGLKKNN